MEEKKQRNEVVPPETFRAEFESRVVGTGHVLTLLNLWHNPANLKRIWVSARV